jgi:hypothetical protein
LAIVHTESEQPNRKIIQDVMRGWKRNRGQTVDLEGVVAEIASILAAYSVQEVVGDKYSAGWVRQAFERAGISYREAEEKSKAYLEMEPVFAQGRIEILDHPQLIRELRLLERRPRPGGKTIVDHPSGGHDDHANSLALAAMHALQGAFVGPIIEHYGRKELPDWGESNYAGGREPTLAEQLDRLQDGGGGISKYDW